MTSQVYNQQFNNQKFAKITLIYTRKIVTVLKVYFNIASVRESSL